MSKVIPTGLKWLIRALSLSLFILLTWLLGFALDDIGGMRPPDRAYFEEQYLDAGLLQRERNLEGALKSCRAEVQRQVEVQANLRSGSEFARETTQELVDLHRLSIEQGIAISAEQQAALAEAQARANASEEAFLQANTRISELNAEAYRISGELELTRGQIREQRKPAEEAYQQARKQHRLVVAGWKLSFIVPVFALSVWLFTRSRGSRRRPILLSFMLASFLHLALVMNDTFPAEYFKYIALGTGIIAVLGFLTRVLRSAAQPQPALLLKRRRESYFKLECPECAYPFPKERGDTYFCPSCGSGLFEPCSACSTSRHILLPHCLACGTAS